MRVPNFDEKYDSLNILPIDKLKILTMSKRKRDYAIIKYAANIKWKSNSVNIEREYITRVFKKIGSVSLIDDFDGDCPFALRTVSVNPLIIRHMNGEMNKKKFILRLEVPYIKYSLHVDGLREIHFNKICNDPIWHSDWIYENDLTLLFDNYEDFQAKMRKKFLEIIKYQEHKIIYTTGMLQEMKTTDTRCELIESKHSLAKCIHDRLIPMPKRSPPGIPKNKNRKYYHNLKKNDLVTISLTKVPKEYYGYRIWNQQFRVRVITKETRIPKKEKIIISNYKNKSNNLIFDLLNLFKKFNLWNQTTDFISNIIKEFLEGHFKYIEDLMFERMKRRLMDLHKIFQ
jgi:hypothetical protein